MKDNKKDKAEEKKEVPMKNGVERWFLIIAGVILVILLILWGWTISVNDNTEGTQSISFLAVSENERLQAGIEQAAIDYNVDLHMITGYKAGEAEKQLEYLERELWGGTNGVVVAPEDPALLEEFLRSKRITVPTLVLGSVVDEAFASYVDIDNELAGTMLAEAVMERTEKDITLFVPTTAQRDITQRMDAFVMTLQNHRREVEICEIANEDQLVREMHNRQTTAFAFADEQMLPTACRIATEEMQMFGCGFHVSLRDALETHKLEALVVWSDYDIGYLALEQVAARMEGELYIQPEISLYLADASNMYEPPLAQVLFPIG